MRYPEPAALLALGAGDAISTLELRGSALGGGTGSLVAVLGGGAAS